MKTILVPLGGGHSDDAVLAAAWMLAKPLGAHLGCVHVHLSASDAAAHTPHVDFAQGEALRSAIDLLTRRGDERAGAAARTFASFCTAADIPLRSAPGAGPGPSASLTTLQHAGEAVDELLQLSRWHDATVLARAHRPDGLPGDRIKAFLKGSGRPVVLVADKPGPRELGTAVVCWKDDAPSARAMGAAIPMLKLARQTAVLHLYGPGGTPPVLDGPLQHLAWHGISAKPILRPRDGQPVARQLVAVAGELDAGLMVMSQYSRGRTRELLFGGCTEDMLRHGDITTFIY